MKVFSSTSIVILSLLSAYAAARPALGRRASPDLVLSNVRFIPKGEPDTRLPKPKEEIVETISPSMPPVAEQPPPKTPDGNTPGVNAPGTNDPENSVPGATDPGSIAAQVEPPENAAPQNTTPGSPTPEGTTPESTTPGVETPENTAPEVTAPESERPRENSVPGGESEEEEREDEEEDEETEQDETFNQRQPNAPSDTTSEVRTAQSEGSDLFVDHGDMVSLPDFGQSVKKRSAFDGDFPLGPKKPVPEGTIGMEVLNEADKKAGPLVTCYIGSTVPKDQKVACYNSEEFTIRYDNTAFTSVKRHFAVIVEYKPKFDVPVGFFSGGVVGRFVVEDEDINSGGLVHRQYLERPLGAEIVRGAGRLLTGKHNVG